MRAGSPLQPAFCVNTAMLAHPPTGSLHAWNAGWSPRAESAVSGGRFGHAISPRPSVTGGSLLSGKLLASFRRSHKLLAVSFLQREFFRRDHLTCARELVGCVLDWGECSGIVVETEAYAAVGDEACHAHSRPSTRRFIANNPPGTGYVYFNYGVHWMLNVLVKGGTDAAGDGIILIRAAEPLRGIPLMQQRRGVDSLRALCSGPGKLTQAFGVTGAVHGLDLCSSKTGFRARLDKVEVETDFRIGISRAAHLPWRFLLKESPFVSVRAGCGRRGK